MFAFQVSVADELDGVFSVKVTVAVLVKPPLVTVIVAVLFPGLAVVVFTLATIDPFFGPDVGLSESQEASSLAVHVPVASNVMVWDNGLAAPCVAVKARFPGVTVNEGAATVRVTWTVLVVPPAVTVIAAVFVPTEALSGLTLAEMVPLPEPEVGFNVSQAALSLAVQFPFEVTIIPWLAGVEPPCTPV